MRWPFNFVLTLFCLLQFSALAAGGEDAFLPDRLIPYKTAGDVTLNLHTFFPDDFKPSDRRPAIIFFFGGGWIRGTPRQFYEQARFMVDHGMVAFAAEYRIRSLHRTTPFECVKDGKSAVRWVRQHAVELGVDPNCIVAAGGSAGGHVAACTGVIQGFEDEENGISSAPNAMILFNPVLDTTEKGYGAGRFSDEEKTILSPCHHVHPGIVPTLIFHGTADKTVPFENAERFSRLMKEAGNTCELVSFEGKDHGFFNGNFFRPGSDGVDFDLTMARTVRFLTGLENECRGAQFK
jgi:acetyl esterase/lipase